MAVIPVGFAQLNFRFTGTSVPNGAETVLGVSNLLGRDATTLAADAFSAWNAANIENLYVNTCVLTSILAKLGPNATGPSAEVPVNLPGGLVGAGAAPNTAILVHKSTAIGGRQGRGRMYLPGVAEADVDVSGNLDPIRRTAGDGFFAAFLTALDAADMPAVLLHGDADAPTLITGMLLDAVVATQRRRLRG